MSNYDPWIDEVGQGERRPNIAPQTYLTITKLAVEALPDQTSSPFWDRDWITPALKQLLFGQRENNLPLRTFCIIDASLRKNIEGLFDLDSDIIDVPVRCLFKENAAEDLKEVAPYLMDMTLPDGAWDNDDLVPNFHKNFFTEHWGKNTGIVIRTPAPMTDVWRHFRRFTKAVMQEDGNRVFFLFHHPHILLGYLNNISDDPEKVQCFCTSGPDTDYCFLIESGDRTVYEVTVDLAKLGNSARPRFVLSYSDFQPQAEAQKKRRAQRMAQRLKDDFSEELEGQSLEDIAAFTLKITGRFNRYGFVKQEYIHFFTAWSIFYGEGFEEKDPDGLLQAICSSTEPQDDRFARFKTRFDSFTSRHREAS